MYLTEEFVESSEEPTVQQVVETENPASILHHFKTAILFLAGVSAIVQLLLHWFVPGM